MRRSVRVCSIGNLDVTREVSRCVALSGEEIAAFRAVGDALSGAWDALIRGEVDLETAVDRAVLAGELPVEHARLAVSVMAPGRKEWSWVT
ncbi:hypothetical protein [Amycolatopsis sp. FDAARGOS 1241]|uniref:hypothetical protein n=1 Tax=Amycolatopsis sp. FDAARGOS 1241 TaxID=2778070 RepID=UPI0019506499|nr:hypothetical protein [Amycolatopsis sp. FDAARGOS 1241]QRP47548.1 hypothetical protein I6J71_06230 [Amycolatopsis sp. FDAARGOS 1241]